MKALITGSKGFLGRYLYDEAVNRGWDVVGVDIADKGLDAMDFFACKIGGVDVVFHCAAFVNGREGIDGSPAFLHTYNTMLDAAMFTWALRTKPGRVVYFSSSAAYPLECQLNDVLGPLRERDIWPDEPEQPEASYGWSKLHGEQMARDVRAQGVPVAVLRPFSGYGADQDPRYPFRAFLERAKARQDPFEVWGDGTQVRDWVHVSDIVGAAFAAVEQAVDGPVNVCTGVGTSFHELARLFMQAAGYDGDVQLLADKPAGVPYRVGDPALLHEFYTPKITIEQGIHDALR